MNSLTPLMLSIAIAAALSAPMAFAQDANVTADAQQDASAQAATQAPRQATGTTATDATATADAMGAQPAPQAAPQPASASRKVTWSDLDGNKDGKLTKTEAAPIESLGKVFDKADADGDGSLTAEEYKQYLASNGKRGGKHGS